MSATNTGRTVAVALGEVARWRSDEEARQKAEMIEVEQEVRNLQTAIANLQSQLDALHKFQADLGDKKKALALSELQRSHDSVLQTLRDQCRRVVEREALVGQAAKARQSGLAERLAQPDVAGLVSDYEKFKASEAHFALLPESYRTVLLSHHQAVVQKLQDLVGAATSGPISVDAEPIAADVVYAVDVIEGAPDLVVVVLPVTEETHTHWADREDGVQLWLASRALQAVHEASRDCGWHQSHAEMGGHQGLLVVEVDLQGAPMAWVTAFESRLRSAFAQPPELIAARIAVVPTRVEMDYLNPPEGEETEHAG